MRYGSRPSNGVHIMSSRRCLEYEYYFVLEVMREVPRGKKKKVVHRAYIVEPTRVQFYRTHALHCRWHFLRKGILAVHTQCITYEDEFGLVEKAPKDVAAAVANDERMFAFLDNTKNHLLEEIQVVTSSTPCTSTNSRPWCSTIRGSPSQPMSEGTCDGTSASPDARAGQ